MIDAKINSKVTAVRRRMRNNGVTQSLAAWLAIGSLTAIVLSLLRLATAGAIPGWLAIAALAVFFLVGLVIGWRRRGISMADAAMVIDRHYASKDTMTTALSLANGGAKDFIRQPLMKAAAELADRVHPSHVVPLRVPRHSWACLSLIGAAILLIVCPTSIAVRQPKVFDRPDVILIGALPPAERTPLPVVTRELTENSLRAMSPEQSSSGNQDRLASFADRDIVRDYFQSTQSRR